VVNDEKDALVASLDTQREHVLGALAGLPATHAGHLDAARELIDGGQWIVLTC
jgi:hypothetical protein